MRGARGVLINITGGLDMTLFEVDEAANRIRREVDEDANIIFGSSADESMNGRIRVSVVATGIDARQQELPVKLVAIGGGAPVSAVATTQIPQAAPARAPGGFTPRVAAGQAVAPAPMPTPAATRPAQAYAVPVEAEPAPEPVMVAQPEPALRAPAAARPAAPAPAPMTSRFGSIFQRATGLIRRDPVAEPVAPQPAAPVAAQTYRAEPMAQPAPRPQNRAAPQEEMGLDIPTFLRRQSN
jgi:cell division protein FtsZ